MQSLERIIQILESFGLETPELSLGDLAKRTNLPKPSVYRIANALCQYKLLSRNNTNGKYRIGIKLFELGSMYISSLEIREIAFPYMDQLQRETGESIHLGILDDTEVVSIEGLESNYTLRTSIPIGKRAPLYCTAVGKAILAFLSPDERKDILSRISLKPFTSRTLTDYASLEKELEKTRDRGYAIDNGEHEEGIVCVAAPFFNHTGDVIASISVSGPASRMTGEKLERYIELVKSVCDEISRKQHQI